MMHSLSSLHGTNKTLSYPMLVFAPHQAVTGLISDGTQSMEVVWNLCSMTM